MESFSPALVDTHFHIYEKNTPLLTDAWNHKEHPAPIEDALATFTRFGVGHGVISTASIYGAYNDYFEEVLLRHPRLRATANVEPSSTGEIERLRGVGFVGIRLLWRPLDTVPDLKSPEYQRLLRRFADAGWHVHFTDRAERMANTLESLENAGVRVIVDHMGMIDTPDGTGDPGFQAVLRAIEGGRTWVKLSGGFRYRDPRRAEEAAKAIIAAGGWERVMWGSDWPFVGYNDRYTYADAVKSLDQLVPDQDMRRRIGRDTAMDFYFSE